jgi:hypothetical protein
MQRQRRSLLSDWRGVEEPRYPERPAKSLADLVQPILEQCGLADRARLEEVLAAWREIVGDCLAQHTRPDTLSRGVLGVRLLQPAVHHALMQEKPRILSRLRARLPKAGIRDVRFQHG